MYDSTALQNKDIAFLGRYFLDGLKPPPRLTVDQWADQNRYLTTKSSGEPGRWRTSRTPFLKEIMYELSPASRAEIVIFMKGSQIGATEAGINWFLSLMDLTPAPLLHVQPTVDLCKRWSKQRFGPAISDCPRLNDRVFDNKSRDKGNTILQKDFPGGTLIITGANSAAGLRQMPICYLHADEVDGWPLDADGEGDPLELARRRITNFARRKQYITSTPTVAGMSRIEVEFKESDQRYYFVPCPFCNWYQTIMWSKNIKFDNHDPKTVRMICENCAAEIYEYHKTEMLAGGRWRKQNKKSDIPGFHLSSLYAPVGWYSWKSAVADHLKALGDPLRRKVWVNTVLAELWDEEVIATVDHHWLMERQEDYDAEVPEGALVLTAGVDTQDDRLEITVIGMGVDYETWTIGHHVLIGDPEQNQVWDDLDLFLEKEYTHENESKMKVAATCIDAMGHHTDRVYDYCRPRFVKRIFAIQGIYGPGRPLIVRYSKIKNKNVYLFRVSSDSGKELLYTRLKIKEPGPGYYHFPKSLNEDYFKQLTSEKRIPRRGRGLPKLEWVLPPGKRNETLDCNVYALAAFQILNPNLESLKKQNLIYTGMEKPRPARSRRQLSKGVS